MASKQAGKQKLNGEKKEGLALYLERIRQGAEAQWTKDDLQTCMHWQKQITAILIGILWGILPIKGIEGFGGFFLLQVVATITFYRVILGVNEEIHGGAGEVLVEGLHGYAGLFVLFWTLAFNILHV